MIDSKLDERDKRIIVLAVAASLMGVTDYKPYAKRNAVLGRLREWMDRVGVIVESDPTTERPTSHAFLDLLEKLMDEPWWGNSQ